MIRVAVIGYGNIGKYAALGISAAADMELAGIVRRKSQGNINIEGIEVAVAENISDLQPVDVALLCVPTRSVEFYANQCLSLGISTVDSFDIHDKIYDLKSKLDGIARENIAVSIISAGWDPGIDSVVRAIFEASAPNGLTYTNFGPGMSMGHTVAAKSIDGVRDALSMTMPVGYGAHRRIVYLELESGADFENIKAKLLADPYFVNDDTVVYQTDNVAALTDKGHGVHMIRKAAAGNTQNQIFEFKMSIDNPALTSQIMISCARAAVRQKPGAYTMLEFPIIDLLPQ
ncbi:MAG: diaminopimelate dehydrogenase, partial [Defluviitaleaceae bacterium]|nr:diaminopimelate dehydrogenase [Defluviitaleaceae bacterium]